MIETLEQDGELNALAEAEQSAPAGTLQAQASLIDTLFNGESLGDILTDLRAAENELAADALKKLSRACPLSVATTVEMMHRLRGPSLSMEKALELEYRFTYRASEHGDFLEGIRAAIIDKDRQPNWQYADMNVPIAAVAKMLQPLGRDALKLESTT